MADFTVNISDNITGTESITVFSETRYVSVADYIYVEEPSLIQTVNGGGTVPIYGGTGGAGESNQKAAQSFVATGAKISSITLYALKANSPTDNVRISIVSSLDGAPLIQITETLTLYGASFAEHTYSTVVGQPLGVTTGNTYYIQIERTGTRDTSNYLVFGYYAPTESEPRVYSSGSYWQRNNTSWTEDTSRDLYFKIKYEDTVTTAMTISVSVNDNIEVVEFYQLLPYVDTSDDISISESLSVVTSLAINTSDTVTISEDIAMMANDYFLNSILIDVSTPGASGGSNVGATQEPSEPNATWSSPYNTSTWWNFVAPHSGVITIDTNGSNFDTTLHVYTGASLATLVLVTEDDDSGSGARSLVTFSVVSGTTYHIMVAGYNVGTGNIVLNWILDQTVDLNTNISLTENTTVDLQIGISAIDSIAIDDSFADPEHVLTLSTSDSVSISESVSCGSIRYSPDSGMGIKGTLRNIRGNS